MPATATSLVLPADVRRTFRFHIAFALFDAACGGILLNAPSVALRLIGTPNWQLPLRDVCAGFGMIASLYLGSYMARRRKMPFVIVPGMIASTGSLAMAASLWMGSSFWFLLFFGIGGMFEIVTRPAVAAILRTNYPVAERGRRTATVRQWSSLCFLISNLFSAYLLQSAGNHTQITAIVLCLCAGALGVTAIFCFRQIPNCERNTESAGEFHLAFSENIWKTIHVVWHDARYRRFLLGCFIEAFSLTLAVSLLPSLLTQTLKFDYVWCAMLKDGVPTFMAFLFTGMLGRWFDRSNPWVAWAAVRFAYGLDAFLLAITPLAAVFVPSLVYVLPSLGRVSRGCVQGGWWVLWWQIGITYFAPPGEDTSRYASAMVFLNGATKIIASILGMQLAAQGVQPTTLLWIGGVGVSAAGCYSLALAARERRERRPNTFSEFEASCGVSRP